ncbi:MmgE/PrpD family protein [Variovorax sp. LjRoot178]|uniref:MmgE/PrpD family protein n=1 Tax=Variovorax sp. LjRoot178 TaxID=3342277 RepID=UPI003ED076C9
MDPMREIVRHVRRTRYEDLPADVVEAVKKAILDTVGAGLVGSASPLGKIVAAMARESGGNAQSSMLVYGDKVPVQEAAFANAVMSRCRELDDVHEGTKRLGGGPGGHVSVMIVPPILALAESLPRPVSGKDLILAIAIGADIVVRMRCAAGAAGKLGFMAETVSPFAVVAAAGKLLDLDEETIANAMGAAYSFCAGTTVSNADGGWDIWLAAGTGARAGIVAVELARRGYIGTKVALSGAAGLYPLYFRGEYHEQTLLSELGRVFEIANVSIKPYSACKCTHNAIHTALELKRRHGIRPEDIERIAVRTCSWNVKLTVLNDQGEHKHEPRTLNEALFSMPYVIATALVKGDVFPDVLNEDTLGDSDILKLSRKIRVEATSEKDEYMMKEGFPPDDVDIHMKDGSVHSGAECNAKGHPANPMSFGEVEEKFRKCAKFAAELLPARKLDEFILMVSQLDKQGDVRGISTLVCKDALLH